MKVSQRLVFKTLINNVFVVILWVLLFVILLDIIAQSQYLNADYTFQDSLLYVLLMLPSRLRLFLPVIMLISSACVMIKWQANQEFLALQALGCSAKKVLKNFVLVGLCINIICFIFVEGSGPKLLLKAKQIRAHSQQIFLSKQGLWWWSKNQDSFKMLNYVGLDKVVIFVLKNKDNSLDHIIKSKSAIYKNKKWILNDVVVYYQKATESFSNLPVKWLLSESVMHSFMKNTRMMSLLELFERWKYDHSQIHIFQFLYRIIIPIFSTAIFCLFFIQMYQDLYSRRNTINLVKVISLGLAFCLISFSAKFLYNIFGIQSIVLLLLPILYIVFLYYRSFKSGF